MKRMLVLAVLAMAASSVALGQMTGDKSAPKGNVEQELIKLEQDRAQAAVRGDTAFLEQNTADDYTFISARGMHITKAQLLIHSSVRKTKWALVVGRLPANPHCRTVNALRGGFSRNLFK